ncbi:hypothetical protein [Pseudokordiimonas caeni]|uniref:hypothetical protein n=1 Tax=Pseudokordiimonas caeni TaxID=2997908 RepID=UPI002810A356|nr:hypothetical protein [Pseudokordiimonas caeni]
MKYLLIAPALFMLAGCGIFDSKGDEIVFDTRLGPQTEAQAKSLPGDLRGDTDHASHSPSPVVGQNLTSRDGSED